MQNNVFLWCVCRILTAQVGQEQLQQLCPLPARPIDDGGSCKNHSCGVYILLLGLTLTYLLTYLNTYLQLSLVCYSR